MSSVTIGIRLKFYFKQCHGLVDISHKIANTEPESCEKADYTVVVYYNILSCSIIK